MFSTALAVLVLWAATTRLTSAGKTVLPECINCNDGWVPVCDTATGRTYSNACFAANSMVYTFIPGECPPPGCSSCPSLVSPVCSINQAKGKLTTTYDNPCLASCTGLSSWSSYPGACSRACDTQCRGTVTGPSDVVCCPGHVELPSACYAECMGLPGCSLGHCIGADAVAVFETCIEGGSAVLCRDNPCAATEPRCPCWPTTVTCVVNSCQKWYRGKFYGDLCSAVYMDPSSGEVLPKCPVPVKGKGGQGRRQLRLHH